MSAWLGVTAGNLGDGGVSVVAAKPGAGGGVCVCTGGLAAGDFRRMSMTITTAKMPRPIRTCVRVLSPMNQRMGLNFRFADFFESVGVADAGAGTDADAGASVDSGSVAIG